jgi:magnesium chelatase family protein
VREAQRGTAGGEIQEHCHLDRSCRLLIAQARERLNLTARAVHRALRVARTIADLETADPENGPGPIDRSIGPAHLAEALQLRRAIN